MLQIIICNQFLLINPRPDTIDTGSKTNLERNI